MIKKSAFFIFIFTLMIVSFGAASRFIIAQDQSPQELAAADAQKNAGNFRALTEEELLEEAFPDTKKTCAAKAGLFMAVGKSYKEGDAVEEIIPMSLLRPVLEGYYDDLRAKGVDNAYLQNILDYQSCIRTAKLEEGASLKKYNACLKFSNVILDTLDSIKSRQSISTIIDRYENNAPDMRTTAFSYLNDPVLFFIGQIYSTAKKKSYSEAVQMGHSLTVACSS